MRRRFPRIAALRGPAGLRARLAELGCPLPCDDEVLVGPDSPLAQPIALAADRATVPNRFVIQPMEGWDGDEHGRPTPLTERRWRRFGASGAGWIWGGEAVAVRPEGRANPNQLVMNERTAHAIGRLRGALVSEARVRPLIGLQLTHSGRWSRPDASGARPRTAFRQPLLDGRVGVTDDSALMTDGELRDLVRSFARAAALARDQGFDFVDVKHCHGYLLHELLSARRRKGDYGGASLEARTRLLFEILSAVRAAAPGLAIGVRLSVFDGVPRGPDGEPEAFEPPYDCAFGCDPDDPGRIALDEPVRLVRALVAAGVRWINVTAGSPYTVPHLQRPAAFPPSDGYPPPEDPLVGVARLLRAARDLKRAVPEALVVSSGWSYLQEFVPNVAQACLREGWFDAVGLGRMALSYPELPADVLAGRSPARALLCRTFSDCTTAPRNGLVSGCYPLDPFYRDRSERGLLELAKRAARTSGSSGR